MEKQEALNQIRAMYKFMAEPEKDVLLTLIPELKESEDERIMKQIHLCLNECVYHDIIRDYEKDEILSWLEKQKVPLHTLETHKETPNSFTDDRIKNAIWQVLSKGESTKILKTMGVKLSEAFEYLEKQKEQKPVEKISVNEELYEHIRNACACLEDANCSEEELSSKWKKERYDQARYDLEEAMKIISSEQPKEFTHHEVNESLIDAVTHQMEDDENVDDFVRRGIDDIALKYAELGAKWQKEQKPNKPLEESIKEIASAPSWLDKQKPTEWSEEDEKILKGIIGLVDHDQHYGVSNKEMLDWLKSLKNRGNFPKSNTNSPEWSEEDEERIRRIYNFLWKNRKGDTDTVYQIEKDADWLKSLHPQPHWKPNKGQMDALKNVVETYRARHNASVGGDTIYMGIQSLYSDLMKP